MQHFDRMLKELFQDFGDGLTRRLAGAPAREWLNVELAQTVAPRADLVARLEDGALFHLEFQTTNEASMALRMLEYYVLLLKRTAVRCGRRCCTWAASRCGWRPGSTTRG